MKNTGRKSDRIMKLVNGSQITFRQAPKAGENFYIGIDVGSGEDKTVVSILREDGIFYNLEEIREYTKDIYMAKKPTKTELELDNARLVKLCNDKEARIREAIGEAVQSNRRNDDLKHQVKGLEDVHERHNIIMIQSRSALDALRGVSDKDSQQAVFGKVGEAIGRLEAGLSPTHYYNHRDKIGTAMAIDPDFIKRNGCR